MTPLESPQSPLVITLFGPMQALVNGQALPRMRSRKGLWLLALLVLRHDRPVEREWLAVTLWPDLDQTQAFANLRPVLSELRAGLAEQSERLQSPTRHTLCLNCAGADVDVPRFDAAIASGTLSDLEQAVELYRGPLLEGCLEEWVFQERGARERNCLQALQKLGDAALTAGKYADAVAYYQKAVTLDPLCEGARRGWMEGLAKQGDINAALQVYRDYLALLRDVPTATPDAQTRALYERLRTEARLPVHASTASAAAVPTPKVTGYLPHSLTELVGREDEREEVMTRLRRSRLVTLTGMGGIGKTRLALEVARNMAREYADGVWLIALDALTEHRQVLPHIASVLGIKEEAGCFLQASVTHFLHTKRLLLVLDNCEHLLEATAQIAGHLLRECGELRILATSREALEIAGEVAWSVPALSLPNPAHLPTGQATLLRVLMGYEGIQLFVERAQAAQKTFALTAANGRILAQMCFRLEGIPLALELAAARVKSMTVEQIDARLYNELGFLTRGNRAALSRQQTLRATLDWSYALLTEPEKILLRRLSVFAGGWTLEAAEAIAKEEGGRRKEEANATFIHPSSLILPPSDVLTSLADKSLVVFEEREGEAEGRYRLLEMVRQYAAEQLQASGEEEPVKTKHCAWYLELAEEALSHLKGSDQGLWLRRLDTEYDNLRTALAWSEAQQLGAEASLRLAGALWRFWYIRGDYSEGRRYLENALKREGAQARTVARALALNGAGALAYDQEEYATARALFEEGLSIGRELEDSRGISAALKNLGNVALSLGEKGAALALYEESLTFSRKLGDKPGTALTLSNMGIVARHQGDYAAARTLFEESLSLTKELGDRLGTARGLLNMGAMAIQQNDYASARTLFEESLSLARELGDKQMLARSLANLGAVAHGVGELVAARSLHEQCLSLFQELGNRHGIAHELGSLGSIAYDQADYPAAGALYRESLSIFQHLGDGAGAGESLEGLAAVLLAQSVPQKAALLWGAVGALRRTLDAPLPINNIEMYGRLIEQARSTLGEAAFTAAWEQGSALSWEQAVSYALENT